MREKIAVFPGSFDPFTTGHLHVLFEACRLFDKVYVVIENNPEKKRCFTDDVYDYAEKLQQVLQRDWNKSVEVKVWDGLTVDACKWLDVQYIVRGIRDAQDYLYEEKIAKANDMISDKLITTVYFRAASDVSSGLVREMIAHGHKDKVAQYVVVREDNC